MYAYGSNKKNHDRLHFLPYIALILIFILGVTACRHTTHVRIPKPAQASLLAFSEDSTNRIRVRYTLDYGQTWLDGNFPNVTTSQGVGITSTVKGYMHIVFYADATNTLRSIWGLGTSTWDSRPAITSTSPTLVLSAPSATCVDNANICLVAFTTAGNISSIRILDTNSKQWLSTNFAPTHTLNNNLVGAPTITYLNGKILMAWNMQDSGGNINFVIAYGDLVLATSGNVTIPSINWTNITTPTNFNTAGYIITGLTPHLKNDGSNIYLGLFKKSSGGPLHHAKIHVYSSNDNGTTWSALLPPVHISPAHDDRWDMTISSNGNIIVATGGSSLTETYQYQPTIGWTTVFFNPSSGYDPIFNWKPNDYGISLSSNNP